MLDIFNSDAFSLARMTDSINKRPFSPGRIGAMGIFPQSGIDTLTVAIEEKEGVLYLVPAKARGADPTQNKKEGRKLRNLRCVHLPLGDRLEADEIQGVRAFGGETALETIQAKINEKLDTMTQSMEATFEYQRIGAIKGEVLDADGTTVLYNLFTEFDITPYATVNFDLSIANAADGSLRTKCAGIVRNIAAALGATPFMGVHAFCGDEFFDALLQEPEVRATYLGTPMAQVLREGFVYPNGLMIYGAFEFGGIVWENYRGAIGSVSFVDTNSCHLFPVGAPGLFKSVFAPANYIETVNTIGRPLYAKTTPDPKGRFVDIDVQSNPLIYCTRPKVLISGVQQT
jgi:hypothetical protein